MQPTGPTVTPPQSDILKTMQPSPQQIIMSTNKKKKYTQQPPTVQQTQHQYQLNKPFNAMSILKTSTNPQHQQQSQTQSYTNISNRSIQGLCGGNVVTVNNCHINAANAKTLFGLNHHGVVGGGNASAIDTNHIAPPVYGNTTIGGSGGVNSSSCNVGASSNPGHGSGGVGITIGSAGGSSFAHENGIVGINTSSVNVGGCIDNRKYDLHIKNNNKILNNNSFQSPSEFVPSSGSNGTGNIRPTQQTTTIYRGPPTSAAPRSAGRHVPMQPMFQQPMHQSVVMPTYQPFGPRQPAYQNPQFQYSQAIPSYYPYQYYQPLQPSQPHQRGPVSVTPGVGVNVGSTISVQPGSNGPPGATQGQISLTSGAVIAGTVPPGSNTVLGVATTGSGQQQLGVGMSSLVGVPVSSTTSTPSLQNKGRRRKHALDIIHPDTKRNIFEDMAPNEPTSEVENQEQSASVQSEVQIVPSSQAPPQELSVSGPTGSAPVVMPTPVVSAMSDAPSVEIRPTSQKPRNKKIISTTPSKDDHSNSQKLVTTTEEPNKRENQEISQVPTYKLSNSNMQVANFESSHLATSSLLSSTADSSKDSNEISENSNTTRSTADNQITLNTHFSTLTDNKPGWDVGNNNTQVITSSSVNTNSTTLAVTTENIQTSIQNMKLNEKETLTTLTSSLIECDMLDKNVENSNTMSQVEVKDSRIFSHTENIYSNALPAETSANVKKTVEHENIVSSKEILSNMANENRDETDRSTVEEKSFQDIVNNNEEVDILVKNDACTNGEGITENSKPLVQIEEKSNDAPNEKTNSSAGPSTASVAFIINYNEGQWSPQNPTGKKQYDREQLLQLREAKASRVQPDVNNASILPQPNLMPSFARGNNSNKRVQSMVGSIGGNRGDGGNYISKQSSMSGVNARGSSKGMIHVNLSLNQDVKLNETDNAWRPRMLASGKDNEIDPSIQTQREKAELIRSVRGILNKLTPEKFDALVEEIIKLKIDTPDKMEDVMVLVFEKAIDEPNFSVSYARLCHRLITEVKARDSMEKGTKTNLALFKSALLDKTEREFTENVTKTESKEEKLQPIRDKIKVCTDPAEKIELEALLEEEERKIRRRSGGTVRFIGELFKISLLTGKIINHCIEVLLEPRNEDMLECLCKLLTTVGAKFEQTPVQKEHKLCFNLDRVMSRMQAIATKTDKDGARVSSRVRFMLQDVIDLRKNKWQSSRNEAPKTMDQIEKETKTEQLSSQYLNYGGILPGGASSGGNQNTGKREDRGGNRYGDGRSGSGYGGSHSQRGDSGNLRRQQQTGGGGTSSMSGGNTDDNTWHVQTSKGSRSLAVEFLKLEGMNTNLDMGSKKMGAAHQFQWTNRQPAPTPNPSNSFAMLSSLDSNKSTNERDRGGPRNKGSYNKGSMERGRYNDRGIHSRTGSSQGSRENSSSRGNQGGRGLMSTSSMPKSASHKSYSQPMAPRMSAKSTGMSSMSSTSSLNPHQRETLQASQQRACDSSSMKFPTTPPEAVFEEPTSAELKLMKSVVLEIIDTVDKTQTITAQIVPCINRIKENQRCILLYYILSDYLHLANVGQLYRRYVANVIIYLIDHKFLSVDHFRVSYEHFCEIASDLIYDVPELWSYIFDFAGPLIAKQIITINDLWIKRLQEDESPALGSKFLKSFLVYCTREIGPSFTRSMWKRFNMKWINFIQEKEIDNFIKSNNLEYIENESLSPEIAINETVAKHITKVVERIELLLNEGSDQNAIIDYINGNIVDADKHFIRSLTTVLSKFAIDDSNFKLDIALFQKICIPVLHRYIDSNEDRELECLYAMQLLVHKLEHPRGLLSELFAELYDNDVIPQESFIKWRDSKDQSAGKGVAVKGLNPFFNHILSGETSDENN